MFTLAVTVSEKIKFLIFDLEKVVQGHEGRKSVFTPFDRKCLNVYCRFFFIICASGNIRKHTNLTYLKHLKSKM